MLSSNLDTPVMSETSVILALSKSLNVLSVDGVQSVGDQMGISAVSWILLSVHEPFWDVVLGRSGKDVTHGGDLLLSDFSGSLVAVNLCNLHGKSGESSTNSSDLSQTEWSLLFTVDVCVLHSQNMSEIVRVL